MANTITAASASSAASSVATSSSVGNTTSAADMQNRFLTLLVAQLNNQDPMNPMDNAQMTSQMAQINTVSGLEQLNETVKSLAAQFSSMQMLQASGLVGQQVLSDGNQMNIRNGVGHAAVNLAGSADKVTLQVLGPTGLVLDKVELGPMAAGQQPITWDASKYTQAGSPSFKVTASKAGIAVSATTLSANLVTGVSTDTSGLQLRLQNGQTLPYTDVKTIL